MLQVKVLHGDELVRLNKCVDVVYLKRNIDGSLLLLNGRLLWRFNSGLMNLIMMISEVSRI